MTRKIIAIFAALLLSLTFVACSEQETTEDTTANKIEIPSESESTTSEGGSTESETDEQTPSTDIVFNPCEDDENVYVLHRNKAVILHKTPSYNDGSTLSVANGTELVRSAISENGEWSKVTYENETYYIASQAITTLADLDAGFVALDKTFTVVANVNVRIAPEVTELAGEVTQYNVVGSLAAGDTIKVLAINEETGWLKIEFECEYDGACYVRYNDAWFEGDEAESTETTTEAETEAATEAETESETAASAGK